MRKWQILELLLASVAVAVLWNTQPVSAATTIVNGKCTGFNYNGQVTQKKYCAHYLYSNSSSVKSACPVSGTKGNCQDKVRQNLYGNMAPGMGSDTYNSIMDTYAGAIADILITTNMEYCESLGNSTATSECQKSSTWHDYYYENWDETVRNWSTPSNGNGNNNGGNEEGDGSSDDSVIASVSRGSCASILKNFCSNDGTVDLGGLIGMFVTILSGVIVVAGTIGIIICGFIWMSARDNEAQVMQAKKRMADIVVGITAWVLLALVGNLFIPKSSSDINSDAHGNLNSVVTPTNPGGSGSGNGNNNGGGDSSSRDRRCGPDPNAAIDHDKYGTTTTVYKNKFGRSFYTFKQGDSPWAALPAGTSSSGSQGTMSSRGCYRTSIAEMFNSFGMEDFTPSKLSTTTAQVDISTAYSNNTDAAKYLSYTVYDSSSVWKSKIIETMKAGGGVILIIDAAGTSNHFTTGPHKMPLVDYDESNNKVYIANTVKAAEKNGWFDLDWIVTSSEVDLKQIVTFKPKDSNLKCN